jgi:hypothetical protein
VPMFEASRRCADGVALDAVWCELVSVNFADMEGIYREFF